MSSVCHKLSSTRIIVSPTKENEWKREKRRDNFQNDYPESIRSNAYVDFVLLRLIIGLFYWPSTSTNKKVLKKAVRSPLFIQTSLPHVTRGTVKPHWPVLYLSTLSFFVLKTDIQAKVCYFQFKVHFWVAEITFML